MTGCPDCDKIVSGDCGQHTVGGGAKTPITPVMIHDAYRGANVVQVDTKGRLMHQPHGAKCPSCGHEYVCKSPSDLGR